MIILMLGKRWRCLGWAAPTAAAACPGWAKRCAVAVRRRRWSGEPHPARGRAAQANR
ncbi:hypothetical protein [Nostoc sp.]|uniref:hypothetical protein n=1 Tax=Nostoc sp. TaxID=1180 RepID=UPI002FFAA68F